MISRAEQGYEATPIDAAEPEHPRIPVGGADRLFERVSFDAIYRPFEYAKITHRGDRCRVNIYLHHYPAQHRLLRDALTGIVNARTHGEGEGSGYGGGSGG